MMKGTKLLFHLLKIFVLRIIYSGILLAILHEIVLIARAWGDKKYI